MARMDKPVDRPRPNDLFEHLNPEQREAVKHGEGPLLVVAGAGTGKTRVITERIRFLLESRPELEGRNILGLTFGEKAAGEMKHRVIRDVGERGRDVRLSTFHAFCLHEVLLQVNPGLRVLETADHWILLRRNMARLGLKRFQRLAEPGQFLTDFVQFFSRCQDELVTPDDYEVWVRRLRESHERKRAQLEEGVRAAQEEELAKQEEVAQAYRASDALLRERGLVTFGGQLLGAVRELGTNRELLALLRERFRYILVDEFQDTNIAQLELLWLLAGGHRNLVAVGDDDQAIYRFRGASFGSFTIFLKRFAGVQASADDAARHMRMLTQNYRSTKRVLLLASQVIAQNEKSPLLPPKRLSTHKWEGEKVRIVEFGSPAEEAYWVAEEIERLHREGESWKSQAVLYRMHAHRDLLVEELLARGIPFVIRHLSILGNRLVRDLLAYLRLLANPSDTVACVRVLAAPGWNLQAADLVRLAERASKGRGMALWDVLESSQEELAFSRDGRKAAELVHFINDLRAKAKYVSASDILNELAGALDLGVAAREEDRKFVTRLQEFVREWEGKSEEKTLATLVEYLDYYEEAGGQIELKEEAEADAVQFMTVHAAKGLEFDHVFVIRLVHGSFPVRQRKPVLEFPEELMKEERPQGAFHIQEERRLFYVALTRARERLTLTTVLNKRSKPSPFLEDILMDSQLTQAHVQQLAPRVKREPRVVVQAQKAPQELFTADPETLRVYSRIAEWAENFHPRAVEPLQLSASAIDTYASCPQKYLFRSVWSLRTGPQAAMTFGSVLHSTIRQFIGELRKGRRLSWEEVERIYRREWSSAGFEDAYQEEAYRQEGLEELRAFHERVLEEPAEVIAQEKYFELPMENNVVITGRIDQINRHGAEGAEIVDYKTGKPKVERDAQKSLQLSLYALAAREQLDQNPTRLVFYNLKSNEAVAATRDAKQLDEARQKVQEVAADIRAGEFPAQPGFLCRYCEYESICPAYEERDSASKPHLSESSPINGQQIQSRKK